MMDRDQQIEFMKNAEARAQGYLDRWMANPEYRAALLRHLPPQQPPAKAGSSNG
ncbi:hypothetical protein MTBLM5_60130 [Magnetospirillum sp. LM-5]|uniref:hypothetical protein n=1 Tax=Magnetospirillum sp. LM-5 TaxID=2681466 RepID=UPI00137D2A5B|nr:hypothetical protein [Magnetospirillum sp. LM-5]CAA7624002.1 hypothetical protein MTBLM5_60130 [Magnetospirillum sp. LM-5]